MSGLDYAHAVLNAASPEAKIEAAHALTAYWNSNKTAQTLKGVLQDNPARPKTPITVSPRDVPRRGLGKVEGRIYLLHAIAHIEFNAIDLAADMICRFSFDKWIDRSIREAFISDWISVCDDEARHFNLINSRLKELGATYGDHPAHYGLWQAAHATRHDLMARLAIAPMVLEARGLDVTPAMILKLKQVGDIDSAQILQIIYDDEIGHVRIGSKWFNIICAKMGKSPETLFHNLVRNHYSGVLKPPFNEKARRSAGLPPSFYAPLV